MAQGARDESHQNDAIMQKRVAEQAKEDPALHHHDANDAPSLNQRDVPMFDRVHGQTRHTREPHAGEVIGGRTEPPFEVVGLDALSPILGHVDFPATREQIAEKLGDVRIPVTKQRTKTVREILDDVGPNSFASSRELEAAVKQAWQQIADVQGRGSRHDQRDDVHRGPTHN